MFWLQLCRDLRWDVTGGGQLDWASVTKSVTDSNPRSAGHFDGSRQLVLTRLATTPDPMTLYVAPCHSEFRGQWLPVPPVAMGHAASTTFMSTLSWWNSVLTAHLVRACPMMVNVSKKTQCNQEFVSAHSGGQSIMSCNQIANFPS